MQVLQDHLSAIFQLCYSKIISLQLPSLGAHLSYIYCLLSTAYHLQSTTCHLQTTTYHLHLQTLNTIFGTAILENDAPRVFSASKIAEKILIQKIVSSQDHNHSQGKHVQSYLQTPWSTDISVQT